MRFVLALLPKSWLTMRSAGGRWWEPIYHMGISESVSRREKGGC